MAHNSFAPWRKNNDQDGADQSSANAFNPDNNSAFDQTDNTSGTSSLGPVLLPTVRPGGAETSLPVLHSRLNADGFGRRIRFISSGRRGSRPGQCSRFNDRDSSHFFDRDSSHFCNRDSGAPVLGGRDLRGLVFRQFWGRHQHARQRACLQQHLRCELHLGLYKPASSPPSTSSKVCSPTRSPSTNPSVQANQGNTGGALGNTFSYWIISLLDFESRASVGRRPSGNGSVGGQQTGPFRSLTRGCSGLADTSDRPTMRSR